MQAHMGGRILRVGGSCSDVIKNIDTSMTNTRLKRSHAAPGRKMCGWDDVPNFVAAHAGPWHEGNYAATYEFRPVPMKMPDGQAPFYTRVHCEDKSYKPMGNAWEEKDAEDAAGMVWDDAASNASQAIPASVAA